MPNAQWSVSIFALVQDEWGMIPYMPYNILELTCGNGYAVREPLKPIAMVVAGVFARLDVGTQFLYTVTQECPRMEKGARLISPFLTMVCLKIGCPEIHPILLTSSTSLTSCNMSPRPRTTSKESNNLADEAFGAAAAAGRVWGQPPDEAEQT